MRQQPEAVRARLEQLRKCVRSLSLGARRGLHDLASDAPVYARWSANSQLLAYMEQATLWNAINFSLPPETPDPGALGMMMGMGMLMPYQDPNRANSTVFSVSIGFFLCPSDSASPPNPSNGYVGNNYYTNSGGWLSDACEQFPPAVASGLPQGPMYNRSAVGTPV